MTTTTKAIILLALIATLLTFGWAKTAGQEETISAPQEAPQLIATSTEIQKVPEVKAVPKRIATVLAGGTREAWLEDLIACESGGRPGAINPKDRDGTPSYGLLQFKPSTFAMFSKAYGIEGELMDPEAQKAIVVRMMDDRSVKWHKQFPACVRKLGTPPQATPVQEIAEVL